MHIALTALLRAAAGTKDVELAVEAPITAAQLFTRLGDMLGPEVKRLLSSGANDVVVAVNGEIVQRDAARLLQDSDRVTLLMPLAGG